VANAGRLPGFLDSLSGDAGVGMLRLSIRRKIMGIAVALIVLMGATAVLSLAMVTRVGGRMEELTASYIPAYGHLARTNIRSLERALALRRIVIEHSRAAPDAARLDAHRQTFESKGAEVEREAEAARTLIAGMVGKGIHPENAAALAKLESRLDAALNDSRRHLNEEIQRLLAALGTRDDKTVNAELDRVDALRDELNRKLDSIRADMLGLLRIEAATMVRMQHQVLLVAALLTALATALGLLFSLLVSSGMTRPVQRLLEGARAVEAGHLEQKLAVTTQDEIGHLTAAFNRMIEQLRLKERIRETFGKYIDPRVVEGLIDRPALAAEGQRRVMTVLFCDLKGFTAASEGMTPQGLVKVMNRYLTTMSLPIRQHAGIIDKYIGDAIMAYWGPPFTDPGEHARRACLTALEMLERLAPLRAEIPDLLGVRSVPLDLDIRIGIATGEAVVGSIGSDLMMSYTVMGDTVNLASRLEGANKAYGTRLLVSQATLAAAAEVVEAREIDRVAVLGQKSAQPVFEIMGRKDALTPAQETLRGRYAEGLAAYRARRWEEARRAFAACLEAVPGDGPSQAMLGRLEALAAAPPPNGWDGGWQLGQK
jgi:adenylate cyclase